MDEGSRIFIVHLHVFQHAQFKFFICVYYSYYSLTFLSKRIFFIISFGIKLIDVFVKYCISNIEEMLCIKRKKKLIRKETLRLPLNHSNNVQETERRRNEKR